MTPSVERLKTTIKLPSGGYSLKPDIPDGNITIWPWDSEVSNWFLSMTRQGGSARTDVPVQVVRKLTRLPEKVMNRFLVSELFLVMLVGRSLVNGGTLRYEAVCPHCTAKQKPSTIKVPDQLGVQAEKPVDYPGYDIVTLPEVGDELKISMLTVEAAQLATDAAKNISEDGAHAAATIIEVGGGRPADIHETFKYYLALSPSDREYLNKKIRELEPGLDLEIPHACDACEKKFKFNLGLSYDFFR